MVPVGESSHFDFLKRKPRHQGAVQDVYVTAAETDERYVLGVVRSAPGLTLIALVEWTFASGRRFSAQATLSTTMSNLG
jgi:hypothetical protein